MHQPRLFQHHLGGHTNQFPVFAQRLRFPGQTDDADDLPFETQRQVYSLTHAVQMSGNGIINIDNPPLRKHQQRPFVQFTNSLAVSAADNAPAGIHYVNIGINNAHRTRHDILRHFGIKMPASHVTLP